MKILIFTTSLLNRIKTFLVTDEKTLFLITFIVCAWGYKNDYWFSKWTVTLLACSTLFSAHIAKVYKSKLAGFLLWWVMLMGLWGYSWQDNYYTFFSRIMHCTYNLPIDPRDLTLFQTVSPKIFELQWTMAYTCISILFFVIAMTVMSPVFAARLQKIFCKLSVLSSLTIIFQYLFTKIPDNELGLMFNQTSLEGCFIAIIYPLLILLPSDEIKNTKQVILTIVSVIAPPIALLILCAQSHASQPISIWIAVCIFAFLAKKPRLKVGEKELDISFGSRLGLVLLVGLGAFCLLPEINPDFMNSNGRFPIYKMAYDFFIQRWEFITFGLGTGSFYMWGPMLQLDSGLSTQHGFSWLHSDILEIIFGTGLIGGVLALGVGIQAFLRPWKTPLYAFSISFLGYVLTMVFNLPMHYPILAFLGMFLLAVCLRCQYPTPSGKYIPKTAPTDTNIKTKRIDASRRK